MIAERSDASVSALSKLGEGDGILLSEDRTPNMRGALLNGLISELPATDLGDLGTKIDSGAIKTLVVVGEDLTKLGVSEESLKQVKIIYFGSHTNEVSKIADVVFPSLSVFEKQGSFVNQSFRLQKFEVAVPGPRGILQDTCALEMIAAPLADEKPVACTMEDIWGRISAKVGQFSEVTWRGIGTQGHTLDATAFLDLPFPETKNLKFDPVAFKEAQATPAGA